jgi:hypothetical protein
MQDRILTTLAVIVLGLIPAIAQQHAAAPVTIPAGTVAPLTLITPIEKKLSVPGDTVHASVAFPIAIGNQIAIPVGTIAEGQIVKVTKKAKQSHEPWVEIHFTRLIFASGYTVNVNATDVSGFSPSSVVAPLTLTQTSAQAAAPPPPPKPKGFFTKIFTFSSKPSKPTILIAAGWQFQMALSDPITIDAASATAAAGTPL